MPKKIKYTSVGYRKATFEGREYHVVIKGYFAEDAESIHLEHFSVLIVDPRVDKDTEERLIKHLDATMYLDTWCWDNERLSH